MKSYAYIQSFSPPGLTIGSRQGRQEKGVGGNRKNRVFFLESQYLNFFTLKLTVKKMSYIPKDRANSALQNPLCQ